MDAHSALDTYRFTTIDVPETERFDAWAAAMSMSDYESPADATVPFDAEFHAVRFGPFVLTSHRWLGQERTVSYRAVRHARMIRADGLDHFYLMLQLTGGSVGEFGRFRVQTRVGGLYLFDMSLPFDCVTTTGDVIGLLIRRDMLRSIELNRYGEVIDPAMGGVLAEHLLTLRGNMSRLGVGDIPYVTRATNSLLRAGLMHSGDESGNALSETDSALIRDARQFIELNLLRTDLTPTHISEAIGVSRAKLYKLFRRDGGIMKQIQRQRLEYAYDVLTDPDMPKERIADVAWRHGFSDEKYFSRVFRARFGCMPREALSLRRGNRAVLNAVETHAPRHGSTFVQWLKAGGE